MWEHVTDLDTQKNKCSSSSIDCITEISIVGIVITFHALFIFAIFCACHEGWVVLLYLWEIWVLNIFHVWAYLHTFRPFLHVRNHGTYLYSVIGTVTNNNQAVSCQKKLLSFSVKLNYWVHQKIGWCNELVNTATTSFVSGRNMKWY